MMLDLGIGDSPLPRSATVSRSRMAENAISYNGLIDKIGTPYRLHRNSLAF